MFQFVELGIVTSIEYNHKSVETARKGQEVCIKIESVPGEAPKMFGRHFDEKDFLVSKVRDNQINHFCFLVCLFFPPEFSDSHISSFDVYTIQS